MRITKNIVIPIPYPVLFLREHGALVIADVHIGYESYLKNKGIFLLHRTYFQIRSIIEEAINATKAKSLIFLGDVKHEFGKPSPQEWVEVKDLLSFLLNKGIEVHVVRGNHDNYIIAILSKFNVPLHDPYMMMDDIMLVHGHKEVEIPKETKVVIMGHEHPAVSSIDSTGSRYKFKCFLIGKIGKRKLIVSPSSSPLSLGMGINEVPKEELLSPMLRSVDIDSFTPIVVEERIGVFRFPQVGVMRSIIKLRNTY